MKKLFLCLSVLGAVFGFAQFSNALIINGGFETGDLTGWTLVGSGGVQTGTPIPTHEGMYMGRITAGLGVGVYTTLSQTLDLMPGDTLDGWYALRTNDRNFRDLAYGKITGAESIFLWEAEMPVPVLVGLSWVGQTDWLSWSWTAPAAGLYTLEFGVANVGNNLWSSIVYLDDINLTPAPPAAPVPEPATLLLLGAGLAGVGYSRKRARF